MKKLLLILVSLYFATAGNSIQYSQSDCLSVSQLLITYNELINSKPDSAIYYLDSAYVLAKKKGCDKIINQCNYYYGMNYSRQRDFKKSDSLLDVSLEYYQIENDSLGISDVLVWKGFNAQVQSNYVIADSLFYLAGTYFESSEHPGRRGDILNNLGVIQDRKGRNDKAIELYLEAIYYLRKSDNYQTLSNSLSNASTIFYNMEKYEEALHYQREALQISESLNNLFTQVMNHSCLSAYQLKLFELVKARQHAQWAVDIAKKLEYSEGLIYASSALGDTYLAVNDFAKALELYEEILDTTKYKLTWPERLRIGMKLTEVNYRMGQPKQAHIQLVDEETLKSLAAIESSQDKMEYYWLESQLNEKEGDIAEAYSNLQKSNEFKRNFDDVNRTTAAIESEAKYKSNILMDENENLKEEKNEVAELAQTRWQYLWLSLIAGVAFVGACVLLWIKRKEEQEKRRNIELERNIAEDKRKKAESLRSEIEHRYLNQMNVAIKLLEESKRNINNEAEFNVFTDFENKFQALSILSQLLSKNNLKKYVNLKEYLTSITDNLVFNIPEGYEDKVQVNPDLVSLTMKSDHALLIGLIYTELFTNSIKHAFVGEVDPLIKITTSKNSNNELTVEYVDNGKGLDINQENNGEGLELIGKMVEQIDGNYKVLDRKNGFGLLVTIPLAA